MDSVKRPFIFALLLFFGLTVAHAIIFDLLTGVPIGKSSSGLWGRGFFVAYFAILGVALAPEFLPAEKNGKAHAVRGTLKHFTIGAVIGLLCVVLIALALHITGIINDQTVENTPAIIRLIALGIIVFSGGFVVRKNRGVIEHYWNNITASNGTSSKADDEPALHTVTGEMNYHKTASGWRSNGEFTPLAAVEFALLAFTDPALKEEGLTAHGTPDEIQLLVGAVQSMNDMSAPQNRLKIWNDVTITAETKRRIAKGFEEYRRREDAKEQTSQKKSDSHRTHSKQKTSPSPKTGALAEALEMFEMEQPFTADDLKKRRRRLLGKVHPDAGGSAFLFKQVENAYEVLKRHVE